MSKPPLINSQKIKLDINKPINFITDINEFNLIAKEEPEMVQPKTNQIKPQPQKSEAHKRNIFIPNFCEDNDFYKNNNLYKKIKRTIETVSDITLGYIRMKESDLNNFINNYEPDSEDNEFITNFKSETGEKDNNIVESFFITEKLLHESKITDLKITKDNKLIDNFQLINNTEILTEYPIQKDVAKLIDYIRDKRLKLKRPLSRIFYKNVFDGTDPQRQAFRKREKENMRLRNSNRLKDEEHLAILEEFKDEFEIALNIVKYISIRESFKLLKIKNLESYYLSTNNTIFRSVKNILTNLEKINDSVKKIIKKNEKNEQELKSQIVQNKEPYSKKQDDVLKKKNNINYEKEKSEPIISNANLNISDINTLLCNIIKELNFNGLELDDLKHQHINLLNEKIKNLNITKDLTTRININSNPSDNNKKTLPFYSYNIIKRKSKFNEDYIDFIMNSDDEYIKDHYTIDDNNNINLLKKRENNNEYLQKDSCNSIINNIKNNRYKYLNDFKIIEETVDNTFIENFDLSSNLNLNFKNFLKNKNNISIKFIN